jgi:hypothetical protein
MALKSAISVVLMALAFGWMQPRSSGLDLTNFDRTVRPQDDLFRAVNGGWLSRTPGQQNHPLVALPAVKKPFTVAS